MATSMKLREPEVAPPSHFGDRVFSGAALAAGVAILVILAGVALFLLYEGIPGMTAEQEDYAPKDNFLSYVGPLAFGTVLASIIALITAVPSPSASPCSSPTTRRAAWLPSSAT
jgi:phosphate transport system permease protein